MRIILSYTINFDMEAIKNSKDEYEKIESTINQSEFIKEIATFLCIIFKIPESAIKGIIWNAIREWQFKKNKTTLNLTDMPIGRRLNTVKEIFYFGKKILIQMLKNPQLENEIIIDIAFEKAFKHYLNYLNKSLC